LPGQGGARPELGKEKEEEGGKPPSPTNPSCPPGHQKGKKKKKKKGQCAETLDTRQRDPIGKQKPAPKNGERGEKKKKKKGGKFTPATLSIPYSSLGHASAPDPE